MHDSGDDIITGDFLKSEVQNGRLYFGGVVLWCVISHEDIK